MEKWKQEIVRLLEQGYSQTNAAKEVYNQKLTDKSMEAIRWHARELSFKVDGYLPTKEKPPVQQSYDKGNFIQEKIIELVDGELISPAYMLTVHDLDPNKWEVISYKNNYWNAQQKGGNKILLYQSKITVKPKEEELSLETIDEYFKDKKFSNDKPKIKPLQYDKDGEVLEICLPDLHSGLLVWHKESVHDYDLKIVKERFYQTALDIVSRCESRQFKKIVLVTLGDLLHFDNEEQKTTKGTFQQADGRLSKIFEITLDMLIDFIDTLVEIAPTEVIYTAGNHDRVAGFMLLKSIEKAYRNDNGVTFDTTPNPHKHRLFGKCLIGWTHGDLAKKNMPHWLQHHAKKEYGNSKFAEVHSGHFHSTKTIETKLSFNQEEEVGGVVIRYLPTLCNASLWEHQQGYTSATKTMMCFIWNENTGLRETWHSNIV